MSRKQTQTSRYRFTVPDSDTDVTSWIASQENLSTSLRFLIKQSVQRDGIVDIFCKPVANPGVTAGRPKGTGQQMPIPAPREQGLEEKREKTAAKKVSAIQEPSDDGFVDPDEFFN